MPLEEPVLVARALASRGYTADREAVTLLANAPDPAAALERAVEDAPPGTVKLSDTGIREAIAATDPGEDSSPGAERAPGTEPDAGPGTEPPSTAANTTESPTPTADNPSVSTGDGGPSSGDAGEARNGNDRSPVETEGSSGREATAGAAEAAEAAEAVDAVGGAEAAEAADGAGTAGPGDAASAAATADSRSGERDPDRRSIEIAGDMTGRSTGTGRYQDFVSVFRDRYERLSKHLKGRVKHRSTDALANAAGGGEAGLVGMVAEINSTKSGHWMIDLEDTRGTFPCLVMKDKDVAEHVDELLLDEVIAVEGSVSGDGSIIFVDEIHFPNIPRTYRPNTADRHVQAALISDVHVGSQEFLADAWSRFANWLHGPEANAVEYLLIAGDMVEGVGVYPDQDEELDIVDIYDQYRAFNEYLKQVPGDMEIIMIPGNHDAVRLAEPQPGFDEQLRSIMSAHDPRIVSNPATVTIEGVNVLMYHGVSLDEVIAELPEEKASYDEPHLPMYQLLKKRHVAPQFGGHTRLAPEAKDYLVIDEVPDVFHTGHVHKFGYGRYRNVLAVNTGCWQAQTAFQESVNIDPDTAYAPIIDLDRLDQSDPMRVYSFN